jgi:peptidoglycan/xylan/chitin deacetylase (PgdA/CDA1 family)
VASNARQNVQCSKPQVAHPYNNVMLWRLLSLLLISSLFVLDALGQSNTVAITVDDLPYEWHDTTIHKLEVADAKRAVLVNQKILASLARHKAPVTGFVNQLKVEQLGTEQGTAMLKPWTSGSFDLGNHLYSHTDANQLSVRQIEDEIVRGEATIAPLMNAAGKKLEFLRFPYNHTGDTKEKHDAVAAFIAKRGYRLAPCTIDNTDWEFAWAYVKMLAKHDDASIVKLRAAYLAYTAAEIDYYSGLNKQVLGYEPPEIMLLHANQLNADMIDEVLSIFQKKGYRFVTLSEAESDPVYQQRDTFITSDGPMWGYRWAKERGVKVNGKLEPEVPEWVTGYGK